MSGETIPRVNASSVIKSDGAMQRIIGRVLKVDASNTSEKVAELEAHGPIKVAWSSAEIELEEGSFFEVLTRYSHMNGGMLRLVEAYNLGTDIDEKLVDAVVQLSEKLPEIF
ncbi:hypothetical protein CANCADRAFT_116686 [Tortispora caseinolytica NRRL Y-17796]|uniref:Replication factor A protein 3 n=1 Tax=Tortispora caseinolytica NRRL Y-17796 TaxID=767744 RepID=A0A1E4TH70_9ASCO|nr:hypothetical protein CANCADRAFT_116686 [Tortispora caseinolytica NRRL Y-17796]